MKHILILLFISFTFVKSDIICPYNVDSYSCLTRIVNNQTNSTCEVQNVLNGIMPNVYPQGKNKHLL